jgi:chitinase
MYTSIIRLSLILCIGILLLGSGNRETTYFGPDIYKPDTIFKVVGYLGTGNFNRINELALDKLTYLNLAFGNPDSEGNLTVSDNADILPVVTKGHEAGLKVFISLGGGGKPDAVNWKSILQPKTRTAFIENIVEYVEKNSLDGVDVDIEGNLFPTVGESYNPFVIELKNALHAKGKGLTAALGAIALPDMITQDALDAFDFINVMVYDKTGIWNTDEIGSHSPFSYAEEAIKYWTEDRRIPANKIILGVPFYGFDFSPPARYINYSEIIKENPLLAYVDSMDMMYFNGIPTIVKKTELAKKKLGGIMIWEISCDMPGDLSLLRALDQTLKARNCSVVTFYRDADGDRYGNFAKPFQACTVPPGYVSNRDDADDTNARKHR